MKYRLALKIGLEEPIEPKSYLGGKMAIGWAVLALGEEKRSGVDFLPALDAPAEVRVVTYADSSEMIEPMSQVDFELMLSSLIQQLPQGSVIEKVPFNAQKYKQFLRKRKAVDSHKMRSEWANTQ